MTSRRHEFTAAETADLLDELDVRLRRRGVAASIFVVGGAAIAANQTRRDRVTEDVDALTRDTAVLEEAQALARERGLSALLASVVALARQRGLPALTTFASLTSRPVFERHGFVITGERYFGEGDRAAKTYAMRCALAGTTAP